MDNCNSSIFIAAVGKPLLVERDWLKEGAVVIDVGINSIESKTTKSGYRLVGDVNYQDCLEVVSRITPVPGGVGPMTVAMLLNNTFTSAKRFYYKQSPVLQVLGIIVQYTTKRQNVMF